MIEESATIREGLIKRIHVDQHRIKADAKSGEVSAVVTVQAQGGPYKGHRVKINGPSELVYEREPLSCGARVWVETHAEVEVIHYDCTTCQDFGLVEEINQDAASRVIDCPDCKLGLSHQR